MKAHVIRHDSQISQRIITSRIYNFSCLTTNQTDCVFIIKTRIMKDQNITAQQLILRIERVSILYSTWVKLSPGVTDIRLYTDL